MGIPLLKGRSLTPTDAAASTRVALINEALARLHWPGEDPVGKRVSFGDTSDAAESWITIVGVVGDVRQFGLARSVEPEIYLPHLQRPSRGMSLVIRAETELETLAAVVRGEVASLDPDQPIAKVQTMERALSDSMGRSRFTLWLLSVFAAAALLLAAFGIYGVISSFVTGRRRELGVRMALGSTKANVMKLVVYQGLAPMVFGTAMGLAAAWGLTRFMASLLYDVTATDPLTFALVPLVLLAAALAASFLPALRAARVDPARALHYE